MNQTLTTEQFEHLIRGGHLDILVGGHKLFSLAAPDIGYHRMLEVVCNAMQSDNRTQQAMEVHLDS